MIYAEHAVCLYPFPTCDRCSCRYCVSKCAWAHRDVYKNVKIRAFDSEKSRRVNKFAISVLIGDDYGNESSIAKGARDKVCVASQIPVADLSDISIVPVSVG